MFLLVRKDYKIDEIIEIKYGLAVRINSHWIISLYISPSVKVDTKEIIPETLKQRMRNKKVTVVGDLNFTEFGEKELLLLCENSELNLRKKEFNKCTFARLGAETKPDKVYSNQSISLKQIKSSITEHCFIIITEKNDTEQKQNYRYNTQLFIPYKNKIQKKMTKLNNLIQPGTTVTEENNNITKIIKKSFNITKRIKKTNNLILPGIIKELKKRRNKIRKNPKRDLAVLMEIKELINSLVKVFKRPENIKTYGPDPRLMKPRSNKKRNINLEKKNKSELNIMAKSFIIEGDSYDYKQIISKEERNHTTNWPVSNFDIITQEQIVDRIKELPNNKAAGLSGIKNEMLKLATPEITKRITVLFNNILKTKNIPKPWKKIMIFPIPKNVKGKYRPIALTEAMRKLFESFIKEKLVKRIRTDNRQAGFTASRAIQDHILVLDDVLKRNKGDLIAVTLDIRAAYDCVNRRLLYEKLKGKIELNEWQILINLLEANQIQIKTNNQCSEFFKLNRGLPQGTVLSPLLFNAFIDDIFTSIPAKYEKNILLFADDIIIIGNNKTEINELIGIITLHANKNNYCLNEEKCFYMANEKKVIKINNTEIKRENSLKYLGIRFNLHGIDVTKTIDETQRKALILCAVIKNIRKKILKIKNPNIILDVYKTHLRPIIEFPLTAVGNKLKTGIEKTERLQRRIIKSLLGWPQKTPSEFLYGLIELEPVESRLKLLNRNLHDRIINNNNNPAREVFYHKKMTKTPRDIIKNRIEPELKKKEFKKTIITENKKGLFGDLHEQYKMNKGGNNPKWNKIVKDFSSKIEYVNEILKKEIKEKLVIEILKL